MDIPEEWERGAVLPAPVLCRIRNTLKDETLTDPAMTPEEIYREVAAVRTCIDCDYWSWDGRHLGKWHERAKEIKADVEIGATALGD